MIISFSNCNLNNSTFTGAFLKSFCYSFSYCFCHIALSCLSRFVTTEIKLMTNAFYFILKAHYFLNFLVMYKNGLIRKIMLTSNFIKSQPATPHINSETSPPPSIINVVCKYLRQFLGTSFSVATLLICGKIE